MGLVAGSFRAYMILLRTIGLDSVGWLWLCLSVSAAPLRSEDRQAQASQVQIAYPRPHTFITHHIDFQTRRGVYFWLPPHLHPYRSLVRHTYTHQTVIETLTHMFTCWRVPSAPQLHHSAAGGAPAKEAEHASVNQSSTQAINRSIKQSTSARL